MKLFINNNFIKNVYTTNFETNIVIPNFGFSLDLILKDENDNIISKKTIISNDFNHEIDENKIYCLDNDIYQIIPWKIFYRKVNESIIICEINL